MKGGKLPSLTIMQNKYRPECNQYWIGLQAFMIPNALLQAVNIIPQKGGPCCIKWCAEHDRWLLEQVYLWWPRPLDWRNPFSSRVIGLWGNLTQRRLHIWEELRTDRSALPPSPFPWEALLSDFSLCMDHLSSHTPTSWCYTPVLQGCPMSPINLQNFFYCCSWIV